MSLILHVNATPASFDEIDAVAVPEPTKTFQPLPHGRLVTEVRSAITQAGLKLKSEEFGLTKDGARLFGLLTVANGVHADDYAFLVGIRNAHDKAFSASLCAGSHVFVCDNLAFNADLVLARKHTPGIAQDLHLLVAKGLNTLVMQQRMQMRQIDEYKAAQLTDARAHDFICRSHLAGVIPSSKIGAVLDEWHEPRHGNHREPTVWRAFNAVTENLKGIDPHELVKRTGDLHIIADRFAHELN